MPIQLLNLSELLDAFIQLFIIVPLPLSLLLLPLHVVHIEVCGLHTTSSLHSLVFMSGGVFV